MTAEIYFFETRPDVPDTGPGHVSLGPKSFGCARQDLDGSARDAKRWQALELQRNRVVPLQPSWVLEAKQKTETTAIRLLRMMLADITPWPL